MIVDEALTDLEMKADPFGLDDIPPSELLYREDKEPPSIYKKSKMRFYRTIGKVSLVRKITGNIQYRKSHRCQSTRSRLRSLNENRAAIGPEKPIVNKRVHKVSEMSVISDEYLKHVKQVNNNYCRSISVDTQRSKKEVQFDFSLKSFNDDNEFAFEI